jgi:hypothetical protein
VGGRPGVAGNPAPNNGVLRNLLLARLSSRCQSKSAKAHIAVHPDTLYRQRDGRTRAHPDWRDLDKADRTPQAPLRTNAYPLVDAIRARRQVAMSHGTALRARDCDHKILRDLPIILIPHFPYQLMFW